MTHMIMAAKPVCTAARTGEAGGCGCKYRYLKATGVDAHVSAEYKIRT